ncbi:DUF3603 family protein [Bacillus sp. WP8]
MDGWSENDLGLCEKMIKGEGFLEKVWEMEKE